MSKEISNFEEELKLILSKKFFFREPNKNKVVFYSIIYLLLTLVGVQFGVWGLTTLFTVFFLCYCLGAGGFGLAIPLGALGVLIPYYLDNIFAMFWVAIHVLVAIIVYVAITNRFSKILLVVYVSAFLFFGIALFVAGLIRVGYISFNPDAIQSFIDGYVNSVVNMYGNNVVDTSILVQSFEELKVYFPAILFSHLFVYALLLVQNTLSSLSREKVIIPVFPKFSQVVISSTFALIYLATTMIFMLLTTSADYSRYSMESLILENVVSLMRWVFVFNGLFTCYYFVEKIKSGGVVFSKVLLFIGMYLFSFLFEIIGLFDSIFKLREYYAKTKGGK